MPFFRRAKLCKNERNNIFYFVYLCHIFFLRATSRKQSGLLVYQITLKTYGIPWSYYLLKSESNFKETEGKIREKAGASYFGYQTTPGSLFNKSSHSSNCGNNYVWLMTLSLITFSFNFQCLIFILFMVKINKTIKKTNRGILLGRSLNLWYSCVYR